MAERIYVLELGALSLLLFKREQQQGRRNAADSSTRAGKTTPVTAAKLNKITLKSVSRGLHQKSRKMIMIMSVKQALKSKPCKIVYGREGGAGQKNTLCI